MDDRLKVLIAAAAVVADAIDRYSDEDDEPGRTSWSDLYKANVLMKRHLAAFDAKTRHRPGLEFIGELPGAGPWKMARFHDMIVCISPASEPHIVRDGKIEPIFGAWGVSKEKLGVKVGQSATE